MSDNLIAATLEIIRLCDALLSEVDSPLNEKQQRWVEDLRDCAADIPETDDRSAGLLNLYNIYVSTQHELLYVAPTPLAVMRTNVYLLLSGEKYGHLNDERRESIRHIQHCIDQIESELDRIRREMY
jgi:hypothetical protein